MQRLVHLVLVAAGAAVVVGPAAAQESADEVAKKLANPVAAMISVPLQFNTDFGYDADDGTRSFLNIQPVIPAAINEHWNLITRIILPVIHQDDVAPDSNQSGLGDTTPTFFFSPRDSGPGGLIWGVGPVFLLPTATDELLGGEQWGIGPSALVLWQTQAGYSYGALVNHLESFAGDDERARISSTFLQPFLARVLSGGHTVGANFEASYDWNGEQATVPLNVYYSKVTRIGKQTISFSGGGRAYLDQPEGGPDWGLRFVATLVFPK